MPEYPAPSASCWLTDAVVAAPSPMGGSGLFAIRPIAAGDLVMRFGGELVDDAELTALMASSSTYVDTLSVYEGVNLVLPADVPNHTGNHSCDPNTWWRDPFSTVARRDIPEGQEVTIDYGTITDSSDFRMACRCGSADCRGVVTGEDWRIGSLQRSYGDHWVPVLRNRISGEGAKSSASAEAQFSRHRARACASDPHR